MPDLLRLLLRVRRLEAESRRRLLVLGKAKSCRWRRIRLVAKVLLSARRWLAVRWRGRVSHAQTRLQRLRTVVNRVRQQNRAKRRVCSLANLAGLLQSHRKHAVVDPFFVEQDARRLPCSA